VTLTVKMQLTVHSKDFRARNDISLDG